MERVDVVVIGGGLAGLAAGGASAQGGVRSILVEQDTLPRADEGLQALTRHELETLGLGVDDAERVLTRMHVGPHDPVELAGRAVLCAVRTEHLHRHLLERARRAGMELRDGTAVGGLTLDPEGWTLDLEGAEPIRAPILVVADGVRSPTLQRLGVADAQRFTPTQSEIITFGRAQFSLKGDELERFDAYRVEERGGPMSRYEILPGATDLTLAFGPVWQSGTGETPWPSATHPATTRALEIAVRKLDLPSDALAVSLEEWRLGGLPCPATFDGGMVVGAAAGHRPPWPLRASSALIRQGEQAGRAAARAVLDKAWTAKALAERLGVGYDEHVASTRAALAFEAEGLRERRSLPPEFWRRGRVSGSSRPSRPRA